MKVNLAELKEFVKSRRFQIHLGLSILAIFVFLSFVYFLLSIYTKHGDSVQVPNFKNMKLSQLEEFVDDKDIEYIISDSIYNPKLPRGIVIDQDPKPGSAVKEGRKVYLTVNPLMPPQIKMPNIIDVSLKQAEAILITYGLKIGSLNYKPDLAKNAVLEISSAGKSLRPGMPVKKGAVIDMVIGDGLGNTDVEVPSLIGLTYEEATFVIKGSSLNLGAVIPVGPIKDTLQAVVYKQIPAPGETSKMKQGDAVDIFITDSSDKVKDANH